MVLKDNMLISFMLDSSAATYMLIICLGYGITITTACIIYYYCTCITIMHIMPPSFYHSLGRFLTTLGLHAQVGDPSYRIIR